MNVDRIKSFSVVFAAACIILGSQWAFAGNMPVWGGAAPAKQPQSRQPGKPLASQPAVNTARTAQPTVIPRSRRVQPRSNSCRRTAPKAVIGTQRTGPVGTQAQWDHWSDLAWKAVKLAVNNFWIFQAHFQNVQIQAVSAICQVNCLNGPDIGQWMRSQLISDSVPAEVAEIFSVGAAGAWKQWQDSVNIPGLPWYPSFAAFPGPQAPPTPNVPMPLIALSTRPADLRFVDKLSARIFREFRGASISPEAREAINNFSKQFSSSFQIWLPSSTVQNVMGQGPVPTFAPPYVPVGPVVAGNVLPTPGVIAGKLH